MKARVQLVVDTINERFGLDIPQTEVETAMATDEGFINFADRYGQSIDWLVGGDVRTLILQRAWGAGWRHRGTAS